MTIRLGPFLLNIKENNKMMNLIKVMMNAKANADKVVKLEYQLERAQSSIMYHLKAKETLRERCGDLKAEVEALRESNDLLSETNEDIIQKQELLFNKLEVKNQQIEKMARGHDAQNRIIRDKMMAKRAAERKLQMVDATLKATTGFSVEDVLKLYVESGVTLDEESCGVTIDE